jgi:broad specificity phosphatase PhoE
VKGVAEVSGVVYLVRHGQASLFGRDYDRLSDLGLKQSRTVGETLAARGVVPALVVRGNLERHRQTAETAIAAAGWDAPVHVDPLWAEIDHVDIIGALRPTYTSHAIMVDDLLTRPEPERAFRSIFDDALQVWLTGGASYIETHLEFRDRVDAALGSVVGRLGRGGAAVVFSSGGPIAGVVASTLGLDTAGWLRMSRLVVNASVTKLVVGESGITLLSFNEHAHVEARDQVTYH